MVKDPEVPEETAERIEKMKQDYEEMGVRAQKNRRASFEQFNVTDSKGIEDTEEYEKYIFNQVVQIQEELDSFFFDLQSTGKRLKYEGMPNEIFGFFRAAVSLIVGKVNMEEYLEYIEEDRQALNDVENKIEAVEQEIADLESFEESIIESSIVEELEDVVQHQIAIVKCLESLIDNIEDDVNQMTHNPTDGTTIPVSVGNDIIGHLNTDWKGMPVRKTIVRNTLELEDIRNKITS